MGSKQEGFRFLCSLRTSRHRKARATGTRRGWLRLCPWSKTLLAGSGHLLSGEPLWGQGYQAKPLEDPHLQGSQHQPLPLSVLSHQTLQHPRWGNQGPERPGDSPKTPTPDSESGWFPLGPTTASPQPLAPNSWAPPEKPSPEVAHAPCLPHSL